MSASSSDSQVLQQKNQKASGQKENCEASDQNVRLLALAEEVAYFGSWIFDTSKPRAIWSRELFRIFGLQPKAEGLTWDEYTKFIHPEDLPKAIENFGVMIKAPLNHKENFDYRIVRSDGSIRILHAQRQVREVTAEGKAKIIVGVDQDVTEQRQALEALKRSEERFRAVAEAADVMVYETDVKTEKIKVLRGLEKLVGYKHDEVDFTVDWVLSQMHPNDAATVRATLRRAAEDPKIDRYVLQYRFRHKNGNYITVKDTAKAVKDQTGKTVLFIGGVRDITQRIEDQERIKQYSRHLEELVRKRTEQLVAYERLAAIGQVAGMVGHDIRNPLQALAGDVYLIETELTELPKQEAQNNIKESLASIEENITYINKIVADLQDYSRQLSAEIRQVNLTDIVADVFKTVALPSNIHLSVNIEPLVPVRLDPVLTRRALTNLVNNAIQAMPNGGKLSISARQEKGSILLSVADTGVGIPDEVKAKVFTPMFTTKAKGQGLGLAVVKRLVEAQGGTITFESKLGEGTKFLIQLPLKQTRPLKPRV